MLHGLHNLGRKRNKAMVSSLSATHRARARRVWQVHIVARAERCQLLRRVCSGSPGLFFLSCSSCSPALRATAGATAQPAQAASRRCAAFDRSPMQFSPLKSVSCLVSRHRGALSFFLSRFLRLSRSFWFDQIRFR